MKCVEGLVIHHYEDKISINLEDEIKLHVFEQFKLLEDALNIPSDEIFLQKLNKIWNDYQDQNVCDSNENFF